MSGGSQPAQTTQINKVELPAWVDQAGQENWASAKDVTSKPYEAYTGQRVADFSPATTNAWNYFNSNVVGSQNPTMDAAKGTMTGLMDYNLTSPDVKAAMIAGRDVSPYLNPMTDTVVDRALSDLDRSRTMALNSNADKAIASKAFGGTRSAIVDAVTNSETARSAGDLSAKLRSDAYDKAMGLLSRDVDTENNIAVGNRDSALKADLAAAGVRGNAATSGAQIATQDRANKMQDYAGLLDIGTQQQTQAQAKLDTQYGDFLEKRNYPLEMLNARLAALGMTPYGRTETSNKTSTSEKLGPDWATIGLGGLQLMSMFSEDTEKTDIQKVGKVPGTDLDAFAYRYKGDPKSYPKVVGLMASDVQKKVPKAVSKIGKKRVVDYTMALRGA